MKRLRFALRLPLCNLMAGALSVCALCSVDPVAAAQRTAATPRKGRALPLEAVVQTGLSDCSRAAFSRDGKYLLASNGHELVLWDVARGRELRKLRGHTDYIGSFAFSPDSRHVASLDHDGNLRLWQTFTGKTAHTMKVSGSRSVSFTPDSKRVVLTSGTGDPPAVWDVATGRPKRLFGEKVSAVHYTPDGRSIVLAHKHNLSVQVFSLWDIARGKVVHRFGRHTCPSWNTDPCVAISPDSRYVALPSKSRRERALKMRFMTIRHLATGRKVRQIGGNEEDIVSACFSPDGDYLATAGDIEADDASSYSCVFRLWNVKTGRATRTIVKTDDTAPERLTLGRGAKYLLAHDVASSTIWNMATGQPATSFAGKEDDSDLHAVEFSPDYKQLVTISSGSIVTLWDVPSEKMKYSLEGLPVTMFGFDFSPNGRYLAVQHSSTKRKHSTDTLLVDLHRGQIARTIGTEGGSYMRFSHDSKGLVAVGPWSPPGAAAVQGVLKLWDVGTGAERRAFTVPGNVLAADFNADRNRLITSLQASPVKTGNGTLRFVGGGVAQVWDVGAGRLIRTLKGDGVTGGHARISPDGAFALTSGSVTDKKKAVAIWRVQDGRRLHTLEGYRDLGSFGPDGRTVALPRKTGLNEAVLLDTRSGGVLKTFRGHRSTVLVCHISPDGSLLATAGLDRTLRLWHVADGAPSHVFHLGDVPLRIRFTPDGKAVAAMTGPSLRVWDTRSGKRLADLTVIESGQWAVLAPDGRFEATEQARKYIHFVRGTEIYELEQFFDEFYTPGLLAQVLGHAEAETPDVDVATKLETSPPPTVEFTAPAPGQTFTKREVELKIRVTDGGGGIDEVKLLHNGKRVSETVRGLKIKRAADIRAWRVQLVQGKNVFLASAYSKGRVESRADKLEIFCKTASKTAAAHVLVVGVNVYKNPKLTLNYARPDAEAFLALVAKRGERLFSKLNVTTLYDKDATKQNLLAALDRIAETAAEQDVFTFFFAGHGSMVDRMFYFVTTENTRLYEPDRLKADAVSITELQQRVAGIKALKQVIVIDACQSGAATEVLAFRGAAEEKALAQLARSAGIHVLAATGSEQFAGELEQLGHGIFTYALLQGLGGQADGTPRDGKVTVYELKAYLDEKVPTLTEEHKGQAQYPNTFSRGQDFPLSLTGQAK